VSLVRPAIVEDEYSYPPSDDVDLEPLGVQVTAASKRRYATRRVYDAVLDDAAIARCRARGRKDG
jgi:hypothetical protein